MPKFYDVSIPINYEMIVYPGNPKPQIHSYASIPANKTNESLICFGSHTGTHVDTQKHIRNDGGSSATLPIDSFFGECKLFDLTKVEDAVYQEDLEEFSMQRDDIILLKTKNSQRGYSKFREDYIHIKQDAAEYLVKIGIKTLGFDYLSAKKFGSDYIVHEILIENLTLFEGLNLSNVPEGEYIFVGFPLSIDCDAAPARVVLMDLKQADR